MITLEQTVDKLKDCCSGPDELCFPEYTYKLHMNPFQHPELDKNIHHLLTLLTALCNSCGGIIYLTLEDPETTVTNERLETFQQRLTELISIYTKLPKEKVNFIHISLSLGTERAWSAIHLKSSKQTTRYQPLYPDREPMPLKCRINVSGVIHFENTWDFGMQEHAEHIPSLHTPIPVTTEPAEDPTNHEATERRLSVGSSTSIHQCDNGLIHPNSSGDTNSLMDSTLGTLEPDFISKNDSSQAPLYPAEVASCSESSNLSTRDLHVSPSEGQILAEQLTSSRGATYDRTDFSQVKMLEWSQNKKDWENYIHYETQTIDKIVDSCSLWKPIKPMAVTPDRTTLKEWFPSVEDMQKTLSEIETKEPGFALACKTWKFHISKCETQSRPPEHICDILTVSSRGKICLWVICMDSNEQNIRCQMEYLLNSGRMIKYQIVQEARHGDLSNICIACRLFFLNTLSQEHKGVRAAIEQSCEMQTHILRICDKSVNFESLQKALALVILLKESPLKRTVGDQTVITLSTQQISVLYHKKRVNYVSGPAGSGKSYTAALLYKLYGRDNSVYICTTVEFVKYLEFSGYNGILIQTDKDLLKEVKAGAFKNKMCIVIDDGHNFACTNSSMKQLFKLMKKNKEMSLYVFADNEYQSFDKKRQEAMRDCIRELSQEVLEIEPHYAYLTTIYRNTKKVVSFVQTVIKESYEGHEKINCGNVETGDGVECIKMKEMDELADYLKVCIRKQYRWSDIAVLLHPSYTDGQIEKCRNILIELLPGSNANYASVFPREGVVVDSVSRFLGLDAPLCIYILPQNLQRQNPNQPIAPLFQKLFKREHPKPDVSIYNPRFKVFMASRATHKAVFVVPEINAELVKQMHFDKFEVGGVFITARNSLL